MRSPLVLCMQEYVSSALTQLKRESYELTQLKRESYELMNLNRLILNGVNLALAYNIGVL